jgi:hypothetical protein
MKPKIHYRVPQSSPPLLALSYTNLVHTISLYFFKIHINIILRTISGSSQLYLLFGFTNHNSVRISHSQRACCMPGPSYSP